MTVVEHLRELRYRLIVCLAAFGVVSVAAFAAFDPITDVLLRPLCSLPPERLGPQGCELTFIGAFEPFMVRLKITAMTALVLASPVWLYQLWAFVVPAMTPKEKRYALPFVLTSIVLFAAGAVFAYSALPAGLDFLFSLGGDNLVPFLRAQEYLSFVGLMLLAFGASFELPLLLFFLGLAEIVEAAQLRRLRRAAVVTIALIAAVVTPSQDPYTMLLMMAPLYGGYELCILALRVVERRRARARLASG
jgi:sec-independent protein translocase protein TatC